ncbi:MAG TPA: acetyl-coenzyme A synthetase N-terminal domain-containing protein, partial [Solimonas sp.]
MSDSQNIQSVLIENRVFPPSRDFVAGAGLNAERLAALHAQAEADHVGFWAGLAKKELAWQTPFTQSLDDSHAP